MPSRTRALDEAARLVACFRYAPGETLADLAFSAAKQIEGFVRRTPPALWSQGNRAPVVLLPGIYERWNFLAAIAERMHEAGHPIIVIPELGRLAGPVDEACETVIARFAAESRDVILIGHSKGGLVARTLLDRAEIGHRIRLVIAINTPFSGSRWARFVRMRRLRDLRPESRQIVTLGRPADANARVVSIGSRLDPLVTESTALPGAVHVVVPRVGHFLPLRTTTTVDLVARIVRRRCRQSA